MDKITLKTFVYLDLYMRQIIASLIGDDGTLV